MLRFLGLFLYLAAGGWISSFEEAHLERLFQGMAFFTPAGLIFEIGLIFYFVGFGYLLRLVFKPTFNLGLKSGCVLFFSFLAAGSLYLLLWVPYLLKDWFAIGWTSSGGNWLGGFRAAALIVSGLIAITTPKIHPWIIVPFSD